MWSIKVGCLNYCSGAFDFFVCFFVFFFFAQEYTANWPVSQSGF